MLAIFLVVALGGPRSAEAAQKQTLPAVATQALPPEARHTLLAIRAGGPYAHERDGVLFGNREGQLPPRARGYYREYTVLTPGVAHRGARRIVAGRAGELYYTDDHYGSFKRILE